jgi:thioredoxin:protein disulfide reductase
MPRSPIKPAHLLLALLALMMAAPAWAQRSELRVHNEWHFAADAVHPGGSVHAALKIRLGGGYKVQSNRPLDEHFPTTLTVTPAAGITVREIVYPEPVPFSVAGYDEPLAVFDSEFVIGVALDVAENVEPGVHTFTAALRYQACDDQICLMPATLRLEAQFRVVSPDEPVAATGLPVFDGIVFSDDPEPMAPAPHEAAPFDADTAPQPVDHGCDVMAELRDFTVLGATGGYLNAQRFITFVDEAESGTLKRTVFEGKGPLAIILLVIVGGILLNLTPCVLPLIPINLAIIGAGARAGSRSRGFALGGAYGLAMAAVYGSLGLIVIFTAASFGDINSKVWFNVAIVILFVVLALAMFDVIAIDFTKFQSKLDTTGLARFGPFPLAFGMGAVTALLAGACIAPIVIAVIVYASDQYASGLTVALALPFFLGLGMALPWPFAGAGLSCLPKPGMWMVRVKQAMGAFILAFAAYYGYIAWAIWDSTRVDAAAVVESVEASVKDGWITSICAGLAQARAENKPVLIDMWATWCKNCLAMDRTTFKDEAVLERLDGYVKIKLQAEDLGSSPAREVLEHFDGIGLPTYAVLRPGTVND